MEEWGWEWEIIVPVGVHSVGYSYYRVTMGES